MRVLLELNVLPMLACCCLCASGSSLGSQTEDSSENPSSRTTIALTFMWQRKTPLSLITSTVNHIPSHHITSHHIKAQITSFSALSCHCLSSSIHSALFVPALFHEVAWKLRLHHMHLISRLFYCPSSTMRDLFHPDSGRCRLCETKLFEKLTQVFHPRAKAPRHSLFRILNNSTVLMPTAVSTRRATPCRAAPRQSRLCETKLSKIHTALSSAFMKFHATLSFIPCISSFTLLHEPFSNPFHPPSQAATRTRTRIPIIHLQAALPRT